jgi:hypothetical protein
MPNFKYVDKITTSEELLTYLQNVFTKSHTDSPFPLNSKGEMIYPFDSAAESEATAEVVTWTVVKPTTPGTKISELILKGTSRIDQPDGFEADGKTPKFIKRTKDFWVKFTNPGVAGNTAKHSQLIVQVLEKYDAATGTAELSGHPVVYEWADHAFTPKTDRSLTKPVYLYMNIMNNRIAMVLVGDPAVNFKDYRKSFLYVGALKPFKYNLDDVDHNVMLTAGAVVTEPAVPQTGYDSGQYTSFGNNTFQMLKTKSGIRFQKHYPSFITQAPAPGSAFIGSTIGDTSVELEPQGFNASAWTRKYHLSPIYVVHPYDGYRGQLEYCISVSKNNILHLDELVVDVNDPAKKWVKEVYIYFDHNTEQNFMKRSANVNMGIAMLKDVVYPTPAT